MCKNVDYSKEFKTIQSAMIDWVKRIPDSSKRPKYINWNGKDVYTGCFIDVPESFCLKLSFISPPDDRQAVDIKLSKGNLFLKDGKKISLLRTWHFPEYESTVEYRGISEDKKLFIYNVYKEIRNDRVFEEKWTNNAGFWFEIVDKGIYRFHCSPGFSQKPNFESLVFELSIKPK